jgi:hypothetical protein
MSALESTTAVRCSVPDSHEDRVAFEPVVVAFEGDRF